MVDEALGQAGSDASASDGAARQNDAAPPQAPDQEASPHDASTAPEPEAAPGCAGGLGCRALGLWFLPATGTPHGSHQERDAGDPTHDHHERDQEQKYVQEARRDHGHIEPQKTSAPTANSG